MLCFFCREREFNEASLFRLLKDSAVVQLFFQTVYLTNCLRQFSSLTLLSLENVAKTVNLQMNTNVFILLERKRRQRFIEYAALTSIQGFFATALFHETIPLVVLLLAVVAFGMAWNLAFARENRRTLDIHSSQRLLGDAIESIVLMVCIAVGIITARFLGVPVLKVMAHVAPTIMLYFLGSFIGETLWARRFFATLTVLQQTNYIANLNRSIIFPYNVSYIRSVLRKNTSNRVQ